MTTKTCTDGYEPRDSTTISDALPAEMRRVREQIIPAYQSVDPAGGFAIAMAYASLAHAEQAMMDGDLVEMIAAYKDLKAFEL